MSSYRATGSEKKLAEVDEKLAASKRQTALKRGQVELREKQARRENEGVEEE